MCGWAAIASIWLLVLVLPLTPWSAGADPGVPLRLVVLGVGLAFGLVWVLRNPDGQARIDPMVMWAGIAGLGVVAICAVASVTPVLGLLGRYPRYEGLPMLAGYGAVVCLGSRLIGGTSPARRGHALAALAVLEIVLAVWAATETLSDATERITTAVGNASDAGVVAVVGFAILIWFAAHESHWLLWTGAASAAVLIGLTASRGTWLAAAAVVAVGIIIVLIQRRVRVSWPVVFVPLAGVVAMVLTPLARSRGSGSSPLAEQTVSGRLLLWRETLDLWKDHLWLGVGPSRFVDEIGAYHSAEWASAIGPDAPPDSPHDVILQVAASCGLLGLAVAVVFAACLLRTLWRRRADEWTPACFLGLGGALVCYGFHFTDLWNIVPLLFLTGSVLTTGTVPIGTGKPRFKRKSVWLYAVVAVVAFASGVQAMVTEAMVITSLSNLKTGRSEALSSLREAVRLKPQDPDLAWRAGHALTVLAGSDLAPADAAVDMLSAACSRLPSSTECLNDLGLAQLRANDPIAADATLTQALTHDPVNITTFLLLASAQDGLGDQSSAEATLLHASDLRPSDPDPWGNLAILYNDQGRTADAEAAQARADELS